MSATDYSPALPTPIAEALDVYGTTIAAHWREGYGQDPARCSCGWTPKDTTRTRTRSVGLHVSAAHKAARKAYDAAVDAYYATPREDRRP